MDGGKEKRIENCIDRMGVKKKKEKDKFLHEALGATHVILLPFEFSRPYVQINMHQVASCV